MSLGSGNVSVKTTRKMVLQLKSISHRLNVYRYMFRSSWDHHQEVYIINTIKLIEISIWIHILAQRVPIIKIVKVVENYALCYDGNYNVRYIRLYKNLYDYIMDIGFYNTNKMLDITRVK
jgi:hypothetical protein